MQWRQDVKYFSSKISLKLIFFQRSKNLSEGNDMYDDTYRVSYVNIIYNTYRVDTEKKIKRLNLKYEF